jgi:hypothetical protein
MCRSSRLHFIGSWKSRVEALMAEHQQQQQQQSLRNPAAAAPAAAPAAAAAAAAAGADGDNSGQPHPLMFGAGSSSNSSAAGKRGKGGAAGGQGRVIVHIDMDCFFAAVATVGRPEFAGVFHEPLAVVHSSAWHLVECFGG